MTLLRKLTWATAVFTAVSFSVFAFAVISHKYDYVKVNRTDSLPHGIYVRTFDDVRLGSIVGVPLPSTMNEYFRRYVEISPQTEVSRNVLRWAVWFQDPHNFVLKPVVAVKGDTICRDPHGVFSVNGKALGTALRKDANGVDYPRWNGCRALVENEAALFSTYSLHSIDSRVFGVVDISSAKTYNLLVATN